MLAEKLLKSIHETRVGVLKAKIQRKLRVIERNAEAAIKSFSSHALKLAPIAFIGENKGALFNLLSSRRVPTTETNKISYNSPVLVEGYAQWDILRDPEKKILDLLKTKPSFRRMLDIGVGGGRTTKYFTEIAKEYVGIDYSENMIEACRKKFQKLEKASFAVIDARNMSVYKDNYFDFVLFSHGGLDAVEHKDRTRILHEIQRVAKEEGYFCFSTSNLDAMLQYCHIRLSKHPKVFTKKLVRVLLIRLLNSEMWKHVRGKHRNSGHTMFNVGAGKWSLTTYCITPKAQVNQLKDAGFKNIRIYDLQGKETHASNATDVELYFLCNINKP